MAKLMLIGEVAHVELEIVPEDGTVLATCRDHPEIFDGYGCGWSRNYDDLRDASEYAADHADSGREE